MSTYYIATAANGGDDAHNGLYATDEGGANGPWLTPHLHDYGVFTAGDILYIRAGTYQPTATVSYNGTGTAEAHITISGYPGETAIIDGNNMTVPASSSGDPLVQAMTSDYIDFVNLTINASGGTGLLVNTGANHCTLTNIHVHDGEGGGISFQGTNGTIDGCTAHGNCLNNLDSILNSGWGAGISVNHTNGPITVKNSTAYDNWGEGISTFESYNVTIEGCISYNNMLNFYLSDCEDAVLQRGLAYCTPGNAIALIVATYDGSGPPYISAQRNIAIGNEGEIPACRYNTIKNCLALGGGRNFTCGTGMLDGTVIHNTFVNADPDLAYDDKANVYFYSGVATGGVFKDNVILQEDTDPTVIAKWDAPTGITLAYNCWSSLPVVGCRGTGDVNADPVLAKTGLTTAGNLTGGIFQTRCGFPLHQRWGGGWGSLRLLQ